MGNIIQLIIRLPSSNNNVIYVLVRLHSKKNRQILPNGTLFFPPFAGTYYRADVHETVYRCRVSNQAGTIVSRDLHISAGIFQYLNHKNQLWCIKIILLMSVTFYSEQFYILKCNKMAYYQIHATLSMFIFFFSSSLIRQLT